MLQLIYSRGSDPLFSDFLYSWLHSNVTSRFKSIWASWHPFVLVMAPRYSDTRVLKKQLALPQANATHDVISQELD